LAHRHGITVVETPDQSAILADGTTAPIAGHTADLSLTIQDHRTSRIHHSKTKFLTLPHLDGMDIVLGMDWLQHHDTEVRTRKRQLILPSTEDPIVVRAGRHQPAAPSEQGPVVDVINAPELIRSIKTSVNSSDTVCVGYIKELTITDQEDPDDFKNRYQPPEWAALEDQVKKEFADVVREDLPPGLPPKRFLRDGRPLEHAIALKPGSEPVAKPPYKLTPEELEAVRANITNYEQQGFIRPALSPRGAPVLFQRKKNGKLRMCVDYRALNHQTIKHAFPMPRIEELLDQLKGYRVISKLDLADGFNHIRVKEADIPKTTFVTQYGACEFLVMPFGLANAPAMFTLMMQDALQDLPATLIFMDDILIFSKTLEDHQNDLRAVLQRLRQHKLFAKPDKCEFFRTASEYLGHLVTQDGIQALPTKVKAISKWPQPSSVKTLRQVLGLTGFYRHFIKNYGDIAAPLTDLTGSIPWKR
jgi:hypothetical protein